MEFGLNKEEYKEGLYIVQLNFIYPRIHPSHVFPILIISTIFSITYVSQVFYFEF